MNVFASRVNEISSISSSSYIINSLDVTTAFVGNVFTTRHHKLALFGLALWIVDIFLNFSFDFYEAHKMYGFAWGTVKVAEWLVFCTGSYFVIFKTVPWMKEGLRKLEKDNHAINYGKSMFKITISVKRLNLCLLVFAIIGGTVQYLIIKFVDKSDHVTFNQSLSAGSVVVLNICRYVSGVHVLYAYGLFWCVSSSVMIMTGYSMLEFQERTSTNLRSRVSSPTFREAVAMFDERLHFVRKSSRSCLVLLLLLLVLTLLSVTINVYLFLYKKRFILYIWHALMPLGLAIYPMCIASWVTKQYQWYFVAVVKAWAEYPEDSSSEDSESETVEPKINALQTQISPPNSPDITEPRKRTHLPDTGHVPVNEPITDMNREKFRNILRGSIRIVGKLQRQRKLTKFNFEKYISYLTHVAPRSGFKIGMLTITWEKVSTSLFLVISIVAVFLQETIFGQ